jgi:olefin beta-lactone synthetase
VNFTMEKQTSEDHRPVVNIAYRLRETAQRMPYKRAVVCPAGRDRFGRVAYSHLTFEQLDRESDCLAAGLESIGIQRGTKTVLMVKPGIEFFVLIFAMFKCGAVPVVVDPGMGARRMMHCLESTRPEAFIGIPLAHLLRVGFPRYFRSILTTVTVGTKFFWGGATLEDLFVRPWQPFKMAATTRDETAAILFTTGSTGPAKGVYYTHGVFDAQVRIIRDQFGISPDEVDLPTFPLFALFDPALGMTAIIPDMDPTKPARVNPKKIIEAIVNHGVTNMFASPALLNRVGRFGKEHGIKLPTLKRVISAGAPVTPANIEQFTAMFTEDARVHTGYGATEAMPVSSFGSDEILSETRQLSEQGFGMCVGRPVAGVEVRIIRISDGPIGRWTDDLLIPDGDTGEIVVRGDQVTRGYFERPKDDGLSKIIDGDTFWHRMGDLGWIDKKGRIWFCGRKSHRVETGTRTLFTIPCEAIFNNHPRVFRSALVGVGNAGQQRPVICIEREPDDDGRDKAELIQALLEMAAASPITEEIQTILFHRSFPVDIRHNSKIFREKLARWAETKISTGS